MEEKKDIYILAIESSCDETAAAVVKNGREVLSNVISSQIDLHTLYGGVVPEIASRKHVENIDGVIKKALADAGMTLEEMDAIGRDLRSRTGGGAAGWACGGKGDCVCGRKAFDWRTPYRRTYLCELYSE